MAYLLPEKLKESTSPVYLDINDDIVDIAMEAISKSVMGIVTVEEALKQYKEKARVLGVKDILDFENEKLGKTTEQTYD